MKTVIAGKRFMASKPRILRRCNRSRKTQSETWIFGKVHAGLSRTSMALEVLEMCEP